MKHPGLTKSHPITDKMKINLDVFRPLMLHRVGREIHRTNIVAIDDGGVCGRSPELSEKLP